MQYVTYYFPHGEASSSRAVTSALQGGGSVAEFGDTGRRETVFTLEATPLAFGPGAAEAIGWECKRFGMTRALVVSDPVLSREGVTARIAERIAEAGIEHEIFDRVRIEPTLDSMQEAADVAANGGFDGYVAIGGGSTLDTAKVADLIATHSGSTLDHVNPPIGGGRTPRGPLRPLLALPTTAGTGSEATPVAVLDIPEIRVKTGISHPHLRPHRAIVDPLLTLTAPAEVVSASGLDVVCHAVESFLARPFDSRPAPSTPGERPPYQGANPVSDVWAAFALEHGGRMLRRAVRSADDIEARSGMMLAATLAGIGFGSAGVHIPHACAYPIAGLKHVYRPPGYRVDHPFVPHGWAVIVTAPAAFRFTYEANPEKHKRAAELLAGRPLTDVDENTLPSVLVSLMQDVGAPSGLAELGYSSDDVDALVEGALRQERLLSVSPREVRADNLADIFRQSFAHW